MLAEIEHCLRSYREIKFIDDTLAADYDRAMQLAKEIKQKARFYLVRLCLCQPGG
jgi:hypothetical protein